MSFPRTPPTVPAGSSVALLQLERDQEASRRSRRAMRYALLAAILFHGALLLVPFPQQEAIALAQEPKIVTVVEIERFRPPPPVPDPPTVQRRNREPDIIIPDADVEPIVRDESPAEPLPELPWAGLEIVIPDAPPVVDAQPVAYRPEMKKPVKLSGPVPVYPEIARKVRKQGTVVLRAVISVEGQLEDLTVIHDPGFGLGDAALVAVRQWTFQPAMLETRSGPEPVAVIYSLSVHFSLQ
jgi:protein TonB